MFHSSGWLLRITSSAKNQVNVTVKDRLSGSLAAVDADVEAIDRWVVIFKLSLQLFQQKMNRVQLGLRSSSTLLPKSIARRLKGNP